jgi:exopolyphosphatase/guanosine-5'-triphosphate,3'-diphosphate pyrophosphatase
MRPVAVIDIGTNSIKMVVAEKKPGGGLAIVAEAREITRLGEGLAATGTITHGPMQRTLSVLRRLADRARRAKADPIAAIGTAALRDAANGDEFLQRAREQSGLSVEIISGKLEAHLAYSAVQLDGSLPQDLGKPLLVCDIGGGSTELVCGEGSAIQGYASFAVGAVSFTERFLSSDPPNQAEYQHAKEEAGKQIASFEICREEGTQIVGIGGTVVNAASVVLGGVGEAHGLAITRDQIAEVSLRLRTVPLSERRQVPGLEPERADIILGGLAILEAVLGSFEAQRFLVSARGIRYGLLMEMLQRV